MYFNGQDVRYNKNKTNFPYPSLLNIAIYSLEVCNIQRKGMCDIQRKGMEYYPKNNSMRGIIQFMAIYFYVQKEKEA